MGKNILEIRDLHVFYGIHEALCGIDMDVEEGKITAVIGSNGAGKTTTINAISGIVKHQGTITFNGKPLPDKANKIVNERIIQVPEGRKIFAGLTVEENLLAGAYTIKDKNEIKHLLEQQYDMFPILGQRRLQDAGTLSGGEQQMLAICRGLMAKPKLLMLDEPSLGLAPVIVSGVFETIKKIREEGITILLIEQNAKKSLSISDKAYVIENGKVTMHGTGLELLNNPEVASAYLGAKRQ